MRGLEYTSIKKGEIIMLAARCEVTESRIIQFPIEKKEENKKGRTFKTTGKSTKMQCLHDKEEIVLLYDTFKKYVEEAGTLAKTRTARRNLTMFICAINIGLRGGDFCSLKWSDIFNDDWTFNHEADYVPQKTIKYAENGEIIKCKHIELSWGSDFETVLSAWLEWKNKYDREQNLNDYIFDSQKGGHIDSKAWYKIVEKTRKEAGIQQKIGTHGLRKTMVNQYIKNSDDKGLALIEMQNMLGHSDIRITQRYACLEKEHVKQVKEKMSLFQEDMLCSM